MLQGLGILRTLRPPSRTSPTRASNLIARLLLRRRAMWSTAEARRCLSIGGAQHREGCRTDAFLAAMTPAGMEAAVMAVEQIEADFERPSLKTWRLEVERARYEVAAG